jgi:hypothetical protein
VDKRHRAESTRGVRLLAGFEIRLTAAGRFLESMRIHGSQANAAHTEATSSWSCSDVIGTAIAKPTACYAMTPARRSIMAQFCLRHQE